MNARLKIVQQYEKGKWMKLAAKYNRNEFCEDWINYTRLPILLFVLQNYSPCKTIRLTKLLVL